MSNWPYDGSWNRKSVNALYQIIPAITTAINQRREAINASTYNWSHPSGTIGVINSIGMLTTMENIYNRTMALVDKNGVETIESVGGERTLSRAYAIDENGDQLDVNSVTTIDLSSFLPINKQTCMRWQFWQYIKEVLQATYRWKYFPDIPVSPLTGSDHVVSNSWDDEYYFHTTQETDWIVPASDPNHIKSLESVKDTWDEIISDYSSALFSSFPQAYRIERNFFSGTLSIESHEFLSSPPTPAYNIFIGASNYQVIMDDIDDDVYPIYSHALLSGTLKYNATKHIKGVIEGGKLYYSYTRNGPDYNHYMDAVNYSYGGLNANVPASAGTGQGSINFTGWNTEDYTNINVSLTLPSSPPFGYRTSLDRFQNGYIYFGVSGNTDSLYIRRSARFINNDGNLVVRFDSPENYLILNTESELTDKQV